MIVIANAAATGGTIATSAIRARLPAVAILSSLFENTPIMHSGLCERMLYACSVCETDRVRNAAVRAAARSPVAPSVT